MLTKVSEGGVLLRLAAAFPPTAAAAVAQCSGGGGGGFPPPLPASVLHCFFLIPATATDTPLAAGYLGGLPGDGGGQGTYQKGESIWSHQSTIKGTKRGSGGLQVKSRPRPCHPCGSVFVLLPTSEAKG